MTDDVRSLETALRAIAVSDDHRHAIQLAEAALCNIGIIPRYIHNHRPFGVDRHLRGSKVNTLRGLAALLEMLETIGREGAADSDVARILVENELELRELRHAATAYMMTWQK